MPRTEIGEVVIDTNGNALSGASCQVNKREGGAATVYSAETGAGTTANPIITDSSGRIEGWLEGGSYDIVVTPPVGSVYTQRWESSSGRNNPITSPAAFPTTPADGEEVRVEVVEGVTWTFKYNAGSASAYKWEYVGGPPLFAEVQPTVAGIETTASLTYVALASAGPSLTVPYAGDYDVEIGASMWNNTNAAAARMSYDIGGTGASDNDSITVGEGTAAGADSVSGNVSRSRRKTALAASTALVSKYEAVVGGTASFRQRLMKVTPVRVTG